MLLKFSYIQLIKHIPKNIHIYLMILKRELTIQDQFKTLGYSMKLEKCAIYVSLVCNGFTYILFLILVPNVTSTANGQSLEGLANSNQTKLRMKTTQVYEDTPSGPLRKAIDTNYNLHKKAVPIKWIKLFNGDCI